MPRPTLTPLFIFLLTPTLGAQTKISGTVLCAKPATSYTLPAGDRPDHSFSITKGTCIWQKPLELAGAQMKTDESTGFSEVIGTTSSDRFYIIGTLSTGDKVYVRTQGTSTVAGGVPQGGNGTWTYEGGTGAFKGLTGKGTYRCRANPDGSSTCDVEGEYRLPK